MDLHLSGDIVFSSRNLWQEEILDHHTPWGYVWKVFNPGFHAKWLLRIPSLKPEVLGSAMDRLPQLHHPHLVPTSYHFEPPDTLVLVFEIPKDSLATLYRQALSQGLRGLPARDLMAELLPVAEALDQLQREHSLQHLSLNPNHFVFHGDKLKLFGFGIMQLAWLPSGRSLLAVNESYAPYEFKAGKYTTKSDQYSLALIYVELTTGTHPLNGKKNVRHKRKGSPLEVDLTAVPAEERGVLTRALQPQAFNRFANCCEFLFALREVVDRPEGGWFPGIGGEKESSGHRYTISSLPGQTPILVPVPVLDLPSPGLAKHAKEERLGLQGREIIRLSQVPEPFTRQLQSLTHGTRLQIRQENVQYVVREDGSLEHGFITQMGKEAIPFQLKRFCHKWRAELLELGE
ncbi:MAG: hypothetical protein AB7P49_19040, partial [Bdellovibrionales bacterium]